MAGAGHEISRKGGEAPRLLGGTHLVDRGTVANQVVEQLAPLVRIRCGRFIEPGIDEVPLLHMAIIAQIAGACLPCPGPARRAGCDTA